MVSQSLPRVICKEGPNVPPPPGVSNKHVSLAPDGTKLIDLEFTEEPLGVTADQGHGFLRIEFRDKIGPRSRYQVLRKLGWGMNSSVWMAFDDEEKKHVAIKSLTGYATSLADKGLTWELHDLLRVNDRLTADKHMAHLPKLYDFFRHQGVGDDGEHLCLVMDILGGNVRELQWSSANHLLPLPLAKRILVHTLRGIHHLHCCDIVHTDIKRDNIMFDLGSWTQADIKALLEADPPRRHPPEESWNCIVQAAASQPLPIPGSLEDAMQRTYLLADLGSSQPLYAQTTDSIMPLGLRAPEILLNGPWDEKVDIWAFGCLLFELLTQQPLFVHETRPQFPSLDEVGVHLWQILSFSQEKVTRGQVESSKLGRQYFDISIDPNEKFCTLKSSVPVAEGSFAAILRKYNVLGQEDTLQVASLMHWCLQFDPSKRPSALDVLKHDWWGDAEV